LNFLINICIACLFYILDFSFFLEHFCANLSVPFQCFRSKLPITVLTFAKSHFCKFWYLICLIVLVDVQYIYVLYSRGMKMLIIIIILILLVAFNLLVSIRRFITWPIGLWYVVIVVIVIITHIIVWRLIIIILFIICISVLIIIIIDIVIMWFVLIHLQIGLIIIIIIIRILFEIVECIALMFLILPLILDTSIYFPWSVRIIYLIIINIVIHVDIAFIVPIPGRITTVVALRPISFSVINDWRVGCIIFRYVAGT